MTPATDPYRTLGLTRGASLDEIKRAYRKLAKEHHPDAAGQQALPRFLAIQAAYEQLVDDGPSKAVPRPPSRPSSADPARADATHRAYGGRTRRTRPAGSGSASGAGRPGSSGQTKPPGSTGSTGSTGPTNGTGSTGDTTGTPGSRSKGKATLGSTSYDGADASQFEPDWGGASWYGTTSGTYWTINPKEYADPRKHGPEYQARARRAAAGRAGTPPPDDAAAAEAASDEATDATHADPGSAPAPGASTAGEDHDAAPGSAPEPPPPEHTTSSWWRATAGPAEATEPTPPRAAPRPTASPRGEPSASDSAAGGAAPDLGAAAADLGRALTDERTAHGRWRFVQAIVGWLPLALGIGWLIGELTGCSRFAASCDGTTTSFIQPIAAVGLLGLLLLVLRLAALAAAGAIAVVVAAVPTALILSATGEAAELEVRATALGATIVVAWLVGVGVAVARRVRTMPPRAGPVS